MTSLTMEYTGVLTLVTCPNEQCMTTYAIPDRLERERRRDHKSIYCPFGHSWYYPGESDLEREKRLRKEAERRRDWADARARAAHDQARAAERSARAYRGHLTRARNKIANGVCPVGNCRRHFDNVQAHIATEHPTWSVIDPETGKAATL